ENRVDRLLPRRRDAVLTPEGDHFAGEPVQFEAVASVEVVVGRAAGVKFPPDFPADLDGLVAAFPPMMKASMANDLDVSTASRRLGRRRSTRFSSPTGWGGYVSPCGTSKRHRARRSALPDRQGWLFIGRR
ncbi:MAG TPA: hypothetical protein VGV15_04860, partial [Terriglobales bacterium]|nr:hypothetical protein [Terriglobales bacterium]